MPKELSLEHERNPPRIQTVYDFFYNSKYASQPSWTPDSIHIHAFSVMLAGDYQDANLDLPTSAGIYEGLAESLQFGIEIDENGKSQVSFDAVSGTDLLAVAGLLFGASLIGNFAIPYQNKQNSLFEFKSVHFTPVYSKKALLNLACLFYSQYLKESFKKAESDRESIRPFIEVIRNQEVQNLDVNATIMLQANLAETERTLKAYDQRLFQINDWINVQEGLIDVNPE